MGRLIFISLILLTSCKQSGEYLTVDFDSFDEETTLVLKCYYHDKSDCGEFGGHHETIQIKKEKDELVYIYKRDSTSCSKERVARYSEAPDKPFQVSGRLSIEKQRIVKRYLDSLQNHQPSWNLISNATNNYEIILTTEFRTKTFKLWPVEEQWKAYQDMGEELKK
jgi:hypothetical protein